MELLTNQGLPDIVSLLPLPGECPQFPSHRSLHSILLLIKQIAAQKGKGPWFELFDKSLFINEK